MTDPKKMAAMALEVLPPPDRLKKAKPPMSPEDVADGGSDDAAEGDEDSTSHAGALAMEDMESAATPAEKFSAFKRAVEACG